MIVSYATAAGSHHTLIWYERSGRQTSHCLQQQPSPLCVNCTCCYRQRDTVGQNNSQIGLSLHCSSSTVQGLNATCPASFILCSVLPYVSENENHCYFIVPSVWWNINTVQKA